MTGPKREKLSKRLKIRYGLQLNKGGRAGSSGNTARGASVFAGESKMREGVNTSLDIRGIPLFPARFRGLLRYTDNFQLTSTSGAVASYVFSCNGLFDPNITGTGHQPAGFDQMMLSYEHYCVQSARLTVTALNTSGNIYPTVALSVRASPTPITAIQQIIEDGLVSLDRLNGANVYGSIRELKTSCNIAKFGGLVQVLDNTDYRGNVAANPVEQSYFHIQLFDSFATTSVVSFEVVIEYESWFTEPRTLSQSLRDVLMRGVKAEGKRSCL